MLELSQRVYKITPLFFHLFCQEKKSSSSGTSQSGSVKEKEGGFYPRSFFLFNPLFKPSKNLSKDLV